jgi:hypothetical protein
VFFFILGIHDNVRQLVSEKFAKNSWVSPLVSYAACFVKVFLLFAALPGRDMVQHHQQPLLPDLSAHHFFWS